MNSVHSLEEITAEGYTVMNDVLSPHELAAVREELAPMWVTAPFGRNDFEGFRSQRIYALLAKSPATAVLVAHPALSALLDELLGGGELAADLGQVALVGGEVVAAVAGVALVAGPDRRQ